MSRLADDGVLGQMPWLGVIEMHESTEGIAYEVEVMDDDDGLGRLS
jgi:hypothetical protein